jgi:DNA polymerase-3 subunit epsilon
MARVSPAFENRTFAIVDVETSGTSPTLSRVIEIGILRIEHGVCVETYRTCVDPGHAISPWITELTGIQQQELEGAPVFEDIIDDVERLLTGAVFVAHNASFDYGFIQNEFRHGGRRFAAQRLCTVRLSRALFPRSKHHDLSSLIKRHGFICESRHRALDDAKVLWDFLQLCADTREAALLPAMNKIIQTKQTLLEIRLQRFIASQTDGEPVIF